MPRLLPLLLALLLATAAQAEVAPDAMRRGEEAAAAFVRQVPPTTPVAALPRLSNPATRPMLEALWNSEAVLAGRPQGEAGTQALQRWGDAGATMLRRYLGILQAGVNDQAELGRRIAAHQDELTRAFTFLLRVGTSVQQGARDRVSRLPEAQRRGPEVTQALERLGTGLAQISQGMLGLLRTQGLRPENSRAMAEALAQDLPLFRPLLTPQLRQAVAQSAAGVAPGLQDAPTREAVEQVRQMLAGAE
ncbi:hypothetical protein [Teichococcus wenyumeiae]|nr:hypothetical protein [Pseudoroseomonas wenyumeiae]